MSAKNLTNFTSKFNCKKKPLTIVKGFDYWLGIV